MKDSKDEASGGNLTPTAFVRRVDGVMSQLCRGMMRHEQNYLTSGTLTMPQFWALEWIGRTGGGHMQELVAGLHLKSSTATMLVDRLVALGLARRSRLGEDRRTVNLQLTAKGKLVVEEIHRQRRAGVRRMFAPLSARERREYLALLEKLARELLKE